LVIFSPGKKTAAKGTRNELIRLLEISLFGKPAPKKTFGFYF
jgi:hypothetical protein